MLTLRGDSMLYTNHLIEKQKFYADLASNPDSNIIQNHAPFIIEKELDEAPVIDSIEAIIENAIDISEKIIPEQTNYLIAKEVNLYRQLLTEALAQLPLTAICLIQEHGHKFNNTDDETNFGDVDDEQESQLNRLSVHFQTTQQLATLDGLDSSTYLEAKQKLVELLTTFKYTAEQIKKISALAIYAFYQNQPNHHSQSRSANPKQQLAFDKILKLSNLNASKLQRELKQLSFEFHNNAILSDFLLPANTITEILIEQILATEQQWLKARQKLAEANSRLVFFITNQYKGSFLDFNDLVQEGQSGLLKAVDRFDPERGFQFSTYAAYWIRQAISRALTRNERVVRLPFGKMANIQKVNRAKHELFSKKGSEATIKELANYTQLSEAEIAQILVISQTATSLDAPVDEEENSVTKVDYLEQQVFTHPLTKISDQQLQLAISEAIKILSPKEAHVINCRFGITHKHEMTLEEIGHELQLTRERVRQIQISAIQKMKRHFGAQLSIFL